MPLWDISEFVCVHPGLSMHACVCCSVWYVHACGRVQVSGVCWHIYMQMQVDPNASPLVGDLLSLHTPGPVEPP